MIKNITVVCTGNICRSPIAEGLLKARSQGRGLEIMSVGTYAMIGQAADPLSVKVMHANGYDISAHRAQQATSLVLTRSDVILTLDQSHTKWLIAHLPQLNGRVFSLGKWRDNMNIADPYKKPPAAFDKAYAEISPAVDDWLARI